MNNNPDESPDILTVAKENISLRVDTFANAAEKREALLRRVEFADKPGIIYVASHRHAESLTDDLVSRGVPAMYYHGGLRAKDREATLSRFAVGDVPVVVATNAFCIGVEKQDIRFVYHADVSDSLDAYNEEIGRAGRDGAPAEAVLFFCSGDVGAQQYKTGGGQAKTVDLELVTGALAESGQPVPRVELARAASMSMHKLSMVIHRLEEAGGARQLPSGEVERISQRSAAEIVQAAIEQQQKLKELRKQRLGQMREYAISRRCRRELLMQYFGYDYAGPCGRCDRCEALGAGMAKSA